MKVAINVCFGGFPLSHEAEMYYAKLKGITLYPFTIDYGGDKKATPYDGGKIPFLMHYSTKPLQGEAYDNDAYYSTSRHEENRGDPDLVKTIEKMGKKANGMCAELKIVKIQDGTDYVIAEYDGLEHIAEKHETWS